MLANQGSLSVAGSENMEIKAQVLRFECKSCSLMKKISMFLSVCIFNRFFCGGYIDFMGKSQTLKTIFVKLEMYFSAFIISCRYFL